MPLERTALSTIYSAVLLELRSAGEVRDIARAVAAVRSFEAVQRGANRSCQRHGRIVRGYKRIPNSELFAALALVRPVLSKRDEFAPTLVKLGGKPVAKIYEWRGGGRVSGRAHVFCPLGLDEPFAGRGDGSVTFESRQGAALLVALVSAWGVTFMRVIEHATPLRVGSSFEFNRRDVILES